MVAQRLSLAYPVPVRWPLGTLFLDTRMLQMTEFSMFTSSASESQDSAPTEVIQDDTAKMQRYARGSSAPQTKPPVPTPSGVTAPHKLPLPVDVARSMRAHNARLPHSAQAHLFVALNGTWQIRPGLPSLTAPGWTSSPFPVPGTNAMGKSHRFRSTSLAEIALREIRNQQDLAHGIVRNRQGQVLRRADGKIKPTPRPTPKTPKAQAPVKAPGPIQPHELPAPGAFVHVKGEDGMMHKAKVMGYCEVSPGPRKRKALCALVQLPFPAMSTLGPVHVAPFPLSHVYP